MTNITQWIVPKDHPSFAGHFPGNPTLPGVVLLDVALHNIATATGFTLDSCMISSVKFLSPALPNDKLLIQHKVLDNGSVHFDITCGLRKIATGRIKINSSQSTQKE
tara:strand:+ start:3331 stop:3651 length:321 start_codon:yes stop_codon:yes gene_type:complete